LVLLCRKTSGVRHILKDVLHRLPRGISFVFSWFLYCISIILLCFLFLTSWIRLERQSLLPWSEVNSISFDMGVFPRYFLLHGSDYVIYVWCRLLRHFMYLHFTQVLVLKLWFLISFHCDFIFDFWGSIRDFGSVGPLGNI